MSNIRIKKMNYRIINKKRKKRIMEKRNKRTMKILKCLGKIIFPLATITVAIVSVFVITKTNEITNTANLLQINDAIQQRTDIVSVAFKNIREYVPTVDNDGNLVDKDKSQWLSDDYKDAITSLLNTFEFACSQYKENKIDKEAFKEYYFILIKSIKKKYRVFFEDVDGRTPYKAINYVHMEWYGR